MIFSVLVLDANQRSALAVTRSLGRSNYVVTTADSTDRALAGVSRYSSQYIQSPNSETNPADYVNWLIKLQSERKFDLVIPVTEITSQLLLMSHQDLHGVKLPFASYEKVMKLAHKGHLVEAANRLGVPAPQSELYESAPSVDPSIQTYPLVLKPCLSKIYTGTHWIATTVRIASSAEELITILKRDTYLQNTSFMLQEFIPGHGAGVFCLFDKGKPLAFFAHHRVREKPPQGGVSVLSRSVEADPLLKDYATRLLSGVNWHGVAMVEFRVSPEGKAYLMEVNTRFWGSLQLAIDSGVDFPALLAQAELTGQAPTIERYRVGQHLRWFLGDVDSLYLYLKSSHSFKNKLARIIQFLTPRPTKCRHEVNRWDDLAPAQYELSIYLKHLLGR
ncbi:carboxylate--amine ligase [Cellvibrio zantedeschiae]|nr:ATP-grasp domain-containing protein [Cellvibrio zantedeschiae]